MKKKQILAAVAVVLVAVMMFFVYQSFSDKAVDGTKNVVIEVVDSKQETQSYSVTTDGEYLIDAMNDAEGLTFSGSESEYGFTVSEINGEVADFNVDSSYWAFYVNDEYCNYGVSEQVINDGDVFRIVYTVY